MIIFIVVTLGIVPFFSSVSADEVNVNIHMGGETAQTRFNNQVLVAGIWHYVNVTLNDQVSQELTLKLFEGTSAPPTAERDATNYYEWKYDESSETPWEDIMTYGDRTYIDDENCLKNGNTYSFFVGIKDTFTDPDINDGIIYHENWTLKGYNGESELISQDIVIQKPTIDLSKSHADVIQFYVDSFTEMNAEGSDFFIIENKGNLPLNIAVDYPEYNEFLECENFSTILSPYTSINCHIIMHSGSWMPGIRTNILGTIEGTIPGSHVIYTDQLTLLSSPIMDVSKLKISVGHATHVIAEVGDGIIFQYEKSLTMSEDEIRSIDAYLSGNGESTLDIWSDGKNVTILEIRSENVVVDTPIDIASTNTSEHTVTIKVEALRENKVGFIYYQLEVDGEIQTFTTQITVGPPLSQGEETSLNAIPLTTIIVILCIILVVGYMIFSYMRHGRR